MSRETAYSSSANIDRTLLKRIQVGTCAQVPEAQPTPLFDYSSSSSDQLSALMDKMNSLSLSPTTSSEKILGNQEEFQNSVAHICSAIQYLQECNDIIYSKNEWPLLIPHGYSLPLAPEGPPFDHWIVPSKPTGVYHLVFYPPDYPFFEPTLLEKC